jgi:tryptophanase
MQEELLKFIPYKIKMVEPIRLISRDERVRKIEEAGLNPFLLQSEDIYIDLLTDSGTGAMSQAQWSALMLADVAYAGSKSFARMKQSVQEIFGFEHVLPTHQGRGAEQVLDEVLVKEGDVVPGNLHFDTTIENIRRTGGRPIDCSLDEIYDPYKEHDFKGNIDIKKLVTCIEKHGPGKIPYILITVTCNSGGGQPVSMANMKEVKAVADKYKLRLFFDVARCFENAYFIKEREKGYKDKSIVEIIRETMSLADGCAMSAKKDAIVNMGGFVAVNDQELYKRLAQVGIAVEGFPTYGGISAKDMEAVAVGLHEGSDVEYLRHRVGKVRYLGAELEKRNVPIVKPIGGHAVFIDGRAFLPHLPHEQFPSHTLCVEAYIEGGIRTVEVGTLLAGRDPDTGKDILPRLELTRLAIPRRVYTTEHLLYVAQIFGRIYDRRDEIKGLEFTYEPRFLRHFQARFKRVV